MSKSLVQFAVVEHRDEKLFVVNRSDTEKGAELALASAPTAKAAAAEFLTKALTLAAEHLKAGEIAAIIKTQRVMSGGK